MCTSQFEIQRGDRQGDPMSPYLFIIVAEVLATAIRTTNIQGIKIGKEEFKYADDLTVFVPDIENAQRTFNLLDQFKTCSRLQVNYKKNRSYVDRFLSKRYSGTPRANMGQYR